MSLDEFREYYEKNHIPLVIRTVRSTLPPGAAFPTLVYKRRYVDAQTPILTASGEHVGFDCMTEIQFESKEAFEKHWIAPLSQNKAIVEDEENFLDRTKIMAYEFEMYKTENGN